MKGNSDDSSPSDMQETHAYLIFYILNFQLLNNFHMLTIKKCSVLVVCMAGYLCTISGVC